MKERNYTLDSIRCIACLLVIIYHSAEPGVASALLATGTSLIGVPCIGLFFMVSGYLLLPTKESLFPFLRRRLNKILYPALFWTAFYLVVALFKEGNYNGQSWVHTLLSIPFTRQGHGVLWFLYTITGLYILSPILSAWLNQATKKEIQFILALWGVTLCYPYIRNYVTLTEDVYGMLYYFAGFGGYFLLGYYVKRFKPELSYLKIAMLYLIPVMVALVSKLMGIELLYHSFGYLSLMVVSMVLGVFLFIRKLVPSSSKEPDKWSRAVINFSNCSFGVYLVHIFVMRSILWKCDFLNSYGGIFQILTSVILTTLLS